VNRELETKVSSINIKNDGSLVTNKDTAIQTAIIEMISIRYPSIVNIVAEEDADNHHDIYDFSGDYLVLDPIDGTENFAANIPMFGIAMSLRHGKDCLDMIYVPSIREEITNLNGIKARKPKPENNILLASTKCLQVASVSGQNVRILGSSSYMFYLLISGKARSYKYCGGAKIWDCYTGLRLAHECGCQITLDDHNISEWLTYPTHRTSFEISWPYKS